MLLLFASLALADYDGGYDSDSGGPCASASDCAFCVQCTTVDCELEQEKKGYTLECQVKDADEPYSVWCDCTTPTTTGDDDDTTGDDDDTTGDDTTGDDDDTTGDDDDEAPDDAAKASGCGCSGTEAPVAVFGLLAALSGLALRRRRQTR
jgi:MYXO-CTERM domain-containing protein